MQQLQKRQSRQSQADLLLLPDGRILVHNLTPALAGLLATFDTDNGLIQARSVSRPEPHNSAGTPNLFSAEDSSTSTRTQ